jgi:hypothetical protein
MCHVEEPDDRSRPDDEHLQRVPSRRWQKDERTRVGAIGIAGAGAARKRRVLGHNRAPVRRRPASIRS